MSKAFTKEDDGGDAVVVPRMPRPRQPAEPAAGVAESGVVRAGAFVRLRGEDSEYQVVEPDAADVRARRISVESPLGRALLGKSAGDEVTVERPRGVAQYTIDSVRYAISEAAGSARRG